MESLATSVVVGGRYRLDGLLGEGGMARVFDAFDLTLERPVAVKVLRPEADALPDVQRRFHQEARFAAQIRHPHIVAILDFGEEKGHSYLVMERLSGITLRNEMASGPLPPGRVVMVVREMLTALRAAHLHGVLHRDIKPSNVLLQDDGHTKLTDFGIAKGLNQGRPLPVNPDETMTGVVLGTPGYLAPERAAGLPASVQSDLYSVGAVMVEALTGTRVAAGTDLPDGLPSVLHRVVGRAMAIDPKSRFESADAMLDALQAPSDRAGVTTQIINAPVVPAPPATSNATRTAAAPHTDPVRTARTAALTEGPVSAPPRRRKLWTVLALTGAAACSLIASLFVLLEGGAQTTGRGVPPSSRAHVASTPTVVTTSTTTTTTATTTTTLVTTTTVPKPHHGNSPLHQLHEERDGALPSPGHGHGGGHGGRGGQG
jgi:eukaryotic-like serine/threonine-protein kinase